MHHKKHFSLEEANSLLPFAESNLEKIIRLKNTLADKGFDIYKHPYFTGIHKNGSGKYSDEVEELINTLKKMENLGILIKNMDNGLIDFPHLRKNGEEVYLCYLLGEKSIKFWHSIQDGFAGRRTMDEL